MYMYIYIYITYLYSVIIVIIITPGEAAPGLVGRASGEQRNKPDEIVGPRPRKKMQECP